MCVKECLWRNSIHFPPTITRNRDRQEIIHIYTTISSESESLSVRTEQNTDSIRSREGLYMKRLGIAPKCCAIKIGIMFIYSHIRSIAMVFNECVSAIGFNANKESGAKISPNPPSSTSRWVAAITSAICAIDTWDDYDDDDEDVFICVNEIAWLRHANCIAMMGKFAQTICFD